ncbi:AT-rich interactive domain-containing protein 4B isoform X1, partial [Lates japonicus]
TLEEPPYLTVGTDVSAKYRGAFCEAKIKTAKRLVKAKVTFRPDLSQLRHFRQTPHQPRALCTRRQKNWPVTLMRTNVVSASTLSASCGAHLKRCSLSKVRAVVAVPFSPHDQEACLHPQAEEEEAINGQNEDLFDRVILLLEGAPRGEDHVVALL